MKGQMMQTMASTSGALCFALALLLHGCAALNGTREDEQLNVVEIKENSHMNQTTKNQSDTDSQDELFFQEFTFGLDGVATLIVALLGIVCNILVIIVLTRPRMHSSTNSYLTALAIWDSTLLLCTTFLEPLRHIPKHDNYYEDYTFAFLVPYVYPLATCAQTATIWLTVSFTVERYIAVCHPLRAHEFCTIKRARIVIAIVSVVSFFYNLVRHFEHVPFPLVDDNRTIYILKPTDLGLNETYMNVYSTFYVIIMFVIPVSTLAVLNTFLIRAVHRSRKEQKTMNVRKSKENNVTIMLASIVMVFLVCQTPALVYNLAFSIDTKYVATDFSYRILSSFRNFLVTLNSAINFILYCAIGQKFRTVFMLTFCRCILNPEQLLSMERTNVYAPTVNMTAVSNAKKFAKVAATKHKNTSDESMNSLRSNNNSNSTANSTLLNQPHTNGKLYTTNWRGVPEMERLTMQQEENNVIQNPGAEDNTSFSGSELTLKHEFAEDEEPEFYLYRIDLQQLQPESII
ncbi:FMRFamide receptor [Lingula anatina]|uniref:FMRFamide receptor n=1 Tax=Lingula anatina TaxID=7574 RepID=A0A1S3K8V2_LINAN|nr:FMRFamide receptor [Lingula anatina]XP_013419046.1 FMRFamide receptor [Lingula anatina]XP_013419047.1 FMRFamide receptor [Lingula anatina]XP_013419048.1 FMRFamide receptor [Lingula anatina]XP_013419049.1 FMRFamide receptor [Lingula anatina]|eukprot:XP_013419045.1 FMRFamide receptor [Lingula anatina]